MTSRHSIGMWLRNRYSAKESRDKSDKQQRLQSPSRRVTAGSSSGSRTANKEQQISFGFASHTNESTTKRRYVALQRRCWPWLRAGLLPMLRAEPAPQQPHKKTWIKSSILRYFLVYWVVAGILVILAILLVATSLHSGIQIFLMGDRFSTSGGWIGKRVDSVLMRRYIQQRQQQAKRMLQQQSSIVFPNVVIKATRTIEHSHSSLYLQEILQRYHSKNDTSLKEFSFPQPFIDNSFGKILPNNPSHGSGGSSSSSRVEIRGASALLGFPRIKPLAEDLKSSKCSSNWLCQRCLSWAFAGTFDACAAFCRPCFVQIMATWPLYPKDDPLIVTLVRDDANPKAVLTQSAQPTQTQPRRIPRIIHQAWEREIRTLEYPELSRLQRAWRSMSGYEYRFYTPPQMESFIAANYPSIVTSAYEILTGNFKLQLDFFKILVLFKQGGVFSDVDVQLEINLDAIIHPTTSIMLPRDPKSILKRHCLWNGFVAAEQGHPVLAYLIETILRIAITGSMDDGSFAQERFILHDIGNRQERTKVWKLRIAGLSIVDGCAWGAAVNRVALNRSDLLADFDVLGQKIAVRSDIGDIVVLLVRTFHIFLMIMIT